MGPYEVLERRPKTFILSRSGKPWTVSVDRLKRAFVELDRPTTATSAPVSLPAPDDSSPASGANSTPLAPLSTRSGRLSRPPARLDL